MSGSARREEFKDHLRGADVVSVAPRTRCPACSASVPLNAHWCSLCHVDLRSKPEPTSVGAVLGRHGPSERDGIPLAVTSPHPQEISSADDRHDTDQDLDLLAATMLTRLAVDEPRTRLFDPADAPGGKWGFAAAAFAAVVVVLLVVYTVLGFVFGR
ncbi:unannotated protein [freshwater metagenome]|uniref:Unannotated protein n=1 Tax=freshwater metagenome TaxID=449393 RepID=A0A6J7L844_9ZZZZ